MFGTYRKVARKEFLNVSKMKRKPANLYTPVLRGKAKAKREFGAKINISLLDGYARVDHFDWDAFNEGQDL